MCKAGQYGANRTKKQIFNLFNIDDISKAQSELSAVLFFLKMLKIENKELNLMIYFLKMLKIEKKAL